MVIIILYKTFVEKTAMKWNNSMKCIINNWDILINKIGKKINHGILGLSY
jgi:hypothetical protein